MDHENEDGVGSVDVRVSSKSVHRAVRNILANEMQLDPVAAKEEIKQQAFALIKTEVIAYLEKKGYSSLGLEDWARRTMTAVAEREARRFMEDAVRQLVGNCIREQVEGVVAAYIRDGMQVTVGYNRKVKVTLVENPK